MVSRASSAALSEERRLFELLTRQSEWIHRRVDRTDIGVDGETTRIRSFDLTMGEDLAIERERGLVTPLTLMTKVPLRRLDTRGPDGRPLPVLGRTDNGDLVTRMLIEAFRGITSTSPPVSLEGVVRAAVMEDDPLKMPLQLAALAAIATPLQAPSQAEADAVVALASDLVQQFLFAVLLPVEYVGQRVIVKVSVTEEVSGGFPDWAFSKDGRSMDLPLLLADSATSAHFEFRAPMGLRVASVRLLDGMGEEFQPPGPSIREGKTAHLTGLERLPADNADEVRARVELEPVADGFVRQTAWATGFVAVLFLLGAWHVEQLQGALMANRSGSVAGAALAVPALFLSVQARRPEHSWVARALFVPRLLNIVTAGLLYAAALYIVTANANEPRLGPVMWTLVGIQLVPTALAVALLRVVSVEPPTV
jgi:hypothetical protein